MDYDLLLAIDQLAKRNNAHFTKRQRMAGGRNDRTTRGGRRRTMTLRVVYEIEQRHEPESGLLGFTDRVTIDVDSGDPGEHILNGLVVEFEDYMLSRVQEWYADAMVTMRISQMVEDPCALATEDGLCSEPFRKCCWLEDQCQSCERWRPWST